MTPARILIVDDEPAIADTLAYALTTEGYVCQCVTLGRDALDAVRAEAPALVILDIGLPDVSGFDVCRALRRFSDVPVIFLTARSDEIDRIVGLELGADDYVAKPFSPREIASRVRAILRRARTGSADAAPLDGFGAPAPAALAAAFAVDNDGGRIAYRGCWLPLTRYEFGLLAALLDHPGHILSRAQLMTRVWRDAEETLERTVDAHIKTLRAKLRAISPDDDPIQTHRGLGYSIRPESS